MFVGSSSTYHTPDRMSSPFPAIYTTLGNDEIMARWNGILLDSARDLLEAMTECMVAQGKKHIQGMTSRIGGQVPTLTEEQFYGMMSCVRRLYRIKYRIGFDYEVLKKKRCTGQKRTIPSSTLRYDWSYVLTFACFTDEEWAECRCECHDGDCLDLEVVAITPTPTPPPTKEEENPI